MDEKKLNQVALNIRADIAGDLFREGKIKRVECFRLELDAALGEDTGDIEWQDNEDFVKNEMG
jgi:hypothetical protein